MLLAADPAGQFYQTKSERRHARARISAHDRNGLDRGKLRRAHSQRAIFMPQWVFQQASRHAQYLVAQQKGKVVIATVDATDEALRHRVGAPMRNGNDRISRIRKTLPARHFGFGAAIAIDTETMGLASRA